MAVWSVVKKNELEGSTRMDAEYYQPKYLSAHYELSRLNVRQLTSFCSYIKKGIFDLSPDNYCEQGIPFVRTTEIKKEIADFDSAVYIPEEVHKKYKKTELRSGDIVFTKIGANIGDSSILPMLYKRYNFSQNVAGAKIKQDKINPYYLAAYLSSKYGKFQLKRVQMLSGQGKLELADIRNILIFNADEGKQESIAAIYKKTEELVDDSIILYSQAEQILLEELGLKDLDLKDDLFYTTTLKEVKNNNRMDTEYYMTKYDYIFKAIEKKGYSRLDLISKFSKILLKKKSEVFYKYIEIGGIDVSTGDVSCKEMQGCDLPTNAKLKISGGELIISEVRPTRGAITIVPDYLTNNCLCSGSFSVFKIKSPIREYIQVFLRSKIGKVLLGHASTGTQYPTITDEDVKAIPIPNLSNNVMENISNKVLNAHVKRESAKALLEQAKHKVEEMIEKEAGVK